LFDPKANIETLERESKTAQQRKQKLQFNSICPVQYCTVLCLQRTLSDVVTLRREENGCPFLCVGVAPALVGPVQRSVWLFYYCIVVRVRLRMSQRRSLPMCVRVCLRVCTRMSACVFACVCVCFCWCSEAACPVPYWNRFISHVGSRSLGFCLEYLCNTFPPVF
jgi:hypothetical protein